MTKQNRLYFLLVTGSALAVLLLLRWPALQELPSRSLLGLTVLIIIGILAEALSFSYRIGTALAHSSVAFVPILATAVLFPPPAAVACALSVTLVTEFAILRKAPWKIAFNAAQGVLATASGASIMWMVHGEGAALSLLGFFIGAALFFFVNQACVGGFIALSQGEGLVSTLSRMMSGAGSNILFDVLVAPIALVVAVFYRDYGAAGLLVISLPLLLVRHAYLSKMQVQRANKDLLRVLIKAIETRDPYTSGHSVRVSILARAIAEDLDLPRSKVEAVETAALLHDIGKIDGIYANLISKPHGLSSEERTIIRTHATKGADFLQGLSSFNDEIIRGVRHHHERYDGRGYPDGLEGEQIPLSARIIMLCDSVDAMLSDRPYRQALSRDDVESELRRCVAEQFDPEVVRVLVEKETLARAERLVDEQRDQEYIPKISPDLPPSQTSRRQRLVRAEA